MIRAVASNMLKAMTKTPLPKEMAMQKESKQKVLTQVMAH